MGEGGRGRWGQNGGVGEPNKTCKNAMSTHTMHVQVKITVCPARNVKSKLSCPCLVWGMSNGKKQTGWGWWWWGNGGGGGSPDPEPQHSVRWGKVWGGRQMRVKGIRHGGMGRWGGELCGLGWVGGTHPVCSCLPLRGRWVGWVGK